MSQIIRYVAPNTECINGRPRPEHHFFLTSDYDDAQDMMPWIFRVCKPHTYTFWHEMVPGNGPMGYTSATQVFHVTFEQDRDAMLFKLRW